MSTNHQKAWDGSEWYTNAFLGIYDWFVLGLHCRFFWGCSSKRILDLYNQHVSGNHLDIGVGTGYFLDKCRFPVDSPRLALVDLNPHSLDIARKRLARYRPETYRRDVLQSLDIGGPKFDSISITHLLHCLPGDMDSKGAVFPNLKSLLNPGGTLFGCTFLYDTEHRSLRASVMFSLANRMGFMFNKHDDLAGLSRQLENHFAEYSIEISGCEAIFRVK